jgi:hypothetical protein
VIEDPKVIRFGMWCREFNDWVRFSFLTDGKRRARWWSSRREVEECIRKNGITDCEPRLLPDHE